MSHTIGLGFTVAYWNTFLVVKDFINNLPNAKGSEVFVFTTMGDSSLNATANFGCILEKKSYTDRWIEKVFQKIVRFSLDRGRYTKCELCSNICLVKIFK